MNPQSQDTRHPSDRQIRYTLYSVAADHTTVVHMIEAQLQQESRWIFAGTDAKAAEQLLAILARGAVTPTTLADVAEDIGVPSLRPRQTLYAELNAPEDQAAPFFPPNRTESVLL